MFLTTVNFDTKPVYVSSSAYLSILIRKHLSGVAMELFPYLAVTKTQHLVAFVGNLF